MEITLVFRVPALITPVVVISSLSITSFPSLFSLIELSTSSYNHTPSLNPGMEETQGHNVSPTSSVRENEYCLIKPELLTCLIINLSEVNSNSILSSSET